VVPAVVDEEDDVAEEDVEVLDAPDDDEPSELVVDVSWEPEPSPEEEEEEEVEEASFARLSVR
jgi:hypothetical protein